MVTIMGVVLSFFFVLTIPGWFALRRYREWRDTPGAPTPWPFYVGAVYVFAVAVLAVVLLLTCAVGRC